MATTAAVVAASAGLVLPAGPAAAAEEVLTPPSSGAWSVEGRGWGHGIGMSQWGAQGAALQGLTADQILDFYYPGTVRFDIGQDYPLRVRLTALAGGAATLGPVPGASLVVTDVSTGAAVTAPAGARVTVTRSAAGFTLVAVQGGSTTPLPIAGVATVAGPVQVSAADGSQVWAYAASGAGTRYPGALRLNATGASTLEVVNHVPMEQYLRGVVPRESPSSWAPAALQAQSVAARTYALAVRAATGTADLCDTTQCQVYGGAATSTAGGAVTELFAASTDAAIAATARVARYYGGGPAFTQFSSTNGGYSKAGSRPYLVARADPYTGTAPGDTRTRWTDSLSVARVQQSCPAGGTLQRMVLTRDGLGEIGGRILSARLECTTGTATVATPAFGLLSSWWRATSTGQPLGNVEVVEAGAGAVRVKGWALDPDTTAPVSVRVTVAGSSATTVANLDRPDVGAAFPGLGSAHGFDATFGAPAGATTVCLAVVNVGQGSDLDLGCQGVVVAAGAPYGSVDALVAAPGSGTGPVVRASGWTVDPDAPTQPVTVRLLVDGVVAATVPASAPRPDVGAALPGVGDAHGYALEAQVTAGTHQVCVAFVDVPTGSALPTTCRSLTAPGGSPLGSVDSAVGAPGGVRVGGWALDPDTVAAAQVRVTVAGTTTTVAASDRRDDIGAVFPAYGATRGYTAVVPAPAGAVSVCVTIANVGAGADTSLGCRTVVVPASSPVGNVEVAVGRPGGVQLSGWALDADTTSPIYVWASVDGVGGPMLASVPRADVAAVVPGAGPAHGFSALLAASPGTRTVCVTAVNTGPGANTDLGCRQVVVPGGSPVGNLEVARGVTGGVQVVGWALDPDTTASPYLLATVDGRAQYLVASGSRPDIGAAFPGYGSAFGFSATLAAAPGARTVCLTISNTGAGSHAPLGCRTVVVP